MCGADGKGTNPEVIDDMADPESAVKQETLLK
jgi:hypothetical protein